MACGKPDLVICAECLGRAKAEEKDSMVLLAHLPGNVFCLLYAFYEDRMGLDALTLLELCTGVVPSVYLSVYIKKTERIYGGRGAVCKCKNRTLLLRKLYHSLFVFSWFYLQWQRNNRSLAAGFRELLYFDGDSGLCH